MKEAVDKYKGTLELRGEKLFVYKCCKDKPSGKGHSKKCWEMIQITMYFHLPLSQKCILLVLLFQVF